jgi:hypothetical protein
MKPVVSIKLSSGLGIDIVEFNKTHNLMYDKRDQHWIIDCIYTSFEGAKRFKQFRSMYKAKALFKAYEWLKEQKGLDDAIKRAFNKKKDHRSPTYGTKMRLRQSRIKSTMGDVRYRITYRDVGDENAIYFGYGDTPREAYMSLVDAMSSVHSAHLSLSSEDYYGPKRWWQFWR